MSALTIFLRHGIVRVCSSRIARSYRSSGRKPVCFAIRDNIRGPTGQSVAPSGAAEENRRLVVDELAAAARDGWRATGQARRYYWLLLAEGHLHRHLFGQMLRRIYALRAPSRVAPPLRLQILGQSKESRSSV